MSNVLEKMIPVKLSDLAEIKIAGDKIARDEIGFAVARKGGEVSVLFHGQEVTPNRNELQISLKFKEELLPDNFLLRERVFANLFLATCVKKAMEVEKDLKEGWSLSKVEALQVAFPKKEDGSFAIEEAMNFMKSKHKESASKMVSKMLQHF